MYVMGAKRHLPGLFLVVLLGACGGGGGGGGTAPANPPGTTTGPPQILSFSPSAGSPGTPVTIQGILFADAPSGNTVRFNGTAATVLSTSATALAVTVPAGATTGRITVTTSGGTATAGADFTVFSGPAWTTRLAGPRGRPAAVVWTGARLVSVGSSDGYQVSDDGLSWRVTNRLASADDIAWDGQMMVAVGSSFWVDTSSDGLTWTTRPLPFGTSPQRISSVARSPAAWVVVGASGRIYSSPDTVTWTQRASGTTNNLTEAVWTGNQFVAVGESGTVVTSPDGVDWTPRTPPTTDNFSALAASGTLIVASSFPSAGSQSALWTSVDGVSWTRRHPGEGAFNDIVYAGGQFVGVGAYITGYSSDGIAWTFDNSLYGLLDGVAYMGSRFIAVGVAPKDGSATMESADGTAWTPIAGGASLTRVARRPADGLLVVTGGDNRRVSIDHAGTWRVDYGTHTPWVGSPFLEVLWSPRVGAFLALVQDAANQRVWSSPDGGTWTMGSNVPCYAGFASNGDGSMLVAVGTSLIGNCLATSIDDGVTWTTRAPIALSGSGQRIANAFWVGSQFIGVGPAGALATSPDGITWTERSSTVNETLRGVAASSQQIVAVGSGGRIVGSGDGGTSWTPRTSGTTMSLNRVTWTGGEFYAVGSGGTVLRSGDGIAWSVLPTPYSADPDAFALNDILWLPESGGRLLVVGSDGLIATSP